MTGGDWRQAWRLVPKKKPVLSKAEAAAEAKKLYDEKKAAKAKAKKKPVTLATPAQYGLSGNPHDQFVKDLIDGLQDGSIVLRSVDVRRTMSHPHIEMLVEMLQLDKTKPTVPQKLHQGPTGHRGAVGPPGVTGATGPAPAYPVTTPQAYSSSAVAYTSVQAAGGNMIQAVQNLPGAKKYGPGGKGMKISEGTEPIVGYRDFKLTQGGIGYFLQSRNGAVWPHRKKMTALCNGNPFVDHDVPDPHCQCGVYAYDKPNNGALQRDNSFLWGEIAMWGEVLICETGYRAEFAYPTALFMRKPGGPGNRTTRVLEATRQELEDSYGVPVFILAERASKSAAQLMEEELEKLLATKEAK